MGEFLVSNSSSTSGLHIFLILCLHLQFSRQSVSWVKVVIRRLFIVEESKFVGYVKEIKMPFSYMPLSRWFFFLLLLLCFRWSSSWWWKEYKNYKKKWSQAKGEKRRGEEREKKKSGFHSRLPLHILFVYSIIKVMYFFRFLTIVRT